jgi:hypothetical protein
MGGGEPVFYGPWINNFILVAPSHLAGVFLFILNSRSGDGSSPG